MHGWNVIKSSALQPGFHFNPKLGSDLSLISSNPTRVCLCEGDQPECAANIQSIFYNETHYPGEEFYISAAIVGDRFGTVDGSVYAQFLDTKVQFGDVLQTSQQVGHDGCRRLKYSVIYVGNNVEVMVLTATDIMVKRYPTMRDVTNIKSQDILYFNKYGYISNLLLSLPVYINITFHNHCPLGFKLNDSIGLCVCNVELQNNHIPCDLNTQSVKRSGTVWVNASLDRVIVYKYCPFNYCNLKEISLSLEHPDLQCAFNRSGTLCGSCLRGLSLVLGSPRCLHCSDNHLALLVAFAIAGLMLVLFIKVLNLTVTQGTINGLLFYANIIWANQTTLFPAGDRNMLTIFIAWLNLDFGIETCFFNGLNAYWKTWLEFVFPIYIWIIISAIIVLSHCSLIASRLFGSNSVPVLATLILLSYSKLLRAIIAALSFAYLQYSDGTKSTVWLVDGNIEYLLSSQHVSLFVFALAMFILLWLPYTVVLLFGQYIQKLNAFYILRRWKLGLIAFLDAYYSPFNAGHQYWIGILLLARCILLLVFAANPSNNPSVNLLATVTVATVLLTYSSGWNRLSGLPTHRH